MVKRFTPKASDYTKRLADVQAQATKLRKQLSALETEERSLKAFLSDFYEEGNTEVYYGDSTLLVSYSESTRTYLDQDKARDLLIKLGKKVPQTKTTVISFKVRVQK